MVGCRKRKPKRRYTCPHCGNTYATMKRVDTHDCKVLQKKDFYPTPESTTKAIMEREKFEGIIWECACGKGDMSEVIKKYNSNVFSSDIEDMKYGEIIDFLGDFVKCGYDNIITNPPYRYAKEFVFKAKEVAIKKVAMLLKLVFLEGINRYDMFQDKEFPLKKVYVFCKRQKIYKEGNIGKNSGLIAYAWFIWDKEYKGKPKIEWIKPTIQKQKEVK